MKQLLLLSAVFIATTSPLRAEVIEEVVVTAAFASDDYYGMPAITLRRKADFLVQEVRFINDSRSPELREQEIIQSIGNFLQAARKADSVELSYGNGFLLPVDLTDDSLQLINDRSRIDTNYVGYLC